MLKFSFFLYIFLLNLLLTNGQITFEINAGEGLVYLLILIFFIINVATPIIRFVYIKYITYIVERANNELSKVSKKFSEKITDVSRKVSQSVRK